MFDFETCRKKLFQMINDLPTIFEVVTGSGRQPLNQSALHHNSSKSKSSGKPVNRQTSLSDFLIFHIVITVINNSFCFVGVEQSRQPEINPSKGVKMSPPAKEDEESGEEEEEEDDEQGATCGACGDNYGADEFWICCDVCERWFHGKCVKITPAKAEHIKQYKCPSCSSKRARV